VIVNAQKAGSLLISGAFRGVTLASMNPVDIPTLLGKEVWV